MIHFAECQKCGYAYQTKQVDPQRIHRPCKLGGMCEFTIEFRNLTTVGKLLVKLKPGDGIAWLAKSTYADRMFAKPGCGSCARRKRAYNDAWVRWVGKTFSERVTSS